MPLCERHFPCELNERFALHQFKEQLMANIPSTYTADGRTMKIRCVREPGSGWWIVPIPAPGIRIRFWFDAHVRERVDRGRENKSLGMAFGWLAIKSREIGLELLDSDANRFQMPVADPVGPFMKHPWRFAGVGVVRDPILFESGLTRGLGNAKSYALGFFQWELMT